MHPKIATVNLFCPRPMWFVCFHNHNKLLIMHSTMILVIFFLPQFHYWSQWFNKKKLQYWGSEKRKKKKKLCGFLFTLIWSLCKFFLVKNINIYSDTKHMDEHCFSFFFDRLNGCVFFLKLVFRMHRLFLILFFFFLFLVFFI